MVSGRPVGPDEHEVVDDLMVETNLVADHVLKDRGAGTSDRQADDGRLALVFPTGPFGGIDQPARTVVTRWPALGLSLLAPLVQLGGRAEAVIGVAGFQQLTGHLPVPIEAIALPVAAVRAADF